MNFISNENNIAVINLDKIKSFEPVETEYIVFCFDDELETYWEFDSEEERDKAYVKLCSQVGAHDGVITEGDISWAEKNDYPLGQTEPKKVNKYAPSYIVTPGEVLETYMKAYHIDIIKLALRLDCRTTTIEGILNEGGSLTEDMAIKLSTLFHRPIHFWLNLEEDYQEDLKRLKK